MAWNGQREQLGSVFPSLDILPQAPTLQLKKVGTLIVGHTNDELVTATPGAFQPRDLISPLPILVLASWRETGAVRVLGPKGKPGWLLSSLPRGRGSYQGRRKLNLWTGWVSSFFQCESSHFTTDLVQGSAGCTSVCDLHALALKVRCDLEMDAVCNLKSSVPERQKVQW